MTEFERLVKKGVFTEDFIKEEVRNDFLVDSKRKKIWAIEIDLLLEFDKVCKKHNLKYWLIGGTLLGAVRHKGFIPWDDDIDVVMMRNDYDKFLTLGDEFSEPYFLQTPYTDPGYFFSFTKLRNSNSTYISKSFKHQKFNQGLFIDIFPLDNSIYERGPEVHQIIDSLIRQLSTYMKGAVIEKDDDNYKEALRIHQKMTETVMQFKNADTEYIAAATATIYNYQRNAYLKKFFDDTVEMDFEGFKFPAPAGYDGALKTGYGNYMELPPIDKRGDWHSNGVFEPDIPYKDYLYKF